MTMRRAVLLIVLTVAASAPVLAGTPAHSPRLASSPEGALLGGYQLRSGADGDFSLFTRASGEPVVPLGRFNGQLAGVAIGHPDGLLYGLTRDGALAAYGDDPSMAAFADGRWNFLDLAWYDGGLIALGGNGNALYLVRPDIQNQTWSEETETVALTDGVGEAVLVPLDNALHLLWTTPSTDLSTGALRHSVRENGMWRELPALPLGEIAALTAFRQKDGIALAALIAPPLNLNLERKLAHKVWRNGAWNEGEPLAERIATRLLSAGQFAGVQCDGRPSWLVAGHDGMYYIDRRGEIRLDTPAASENAGWERVTTILFILGIVALVVLYCRRSRMLSRTMPGRPPDLTSRAAALTIDWFLVSIGLSAYHIAAGDMNIFAELLTFGEVNRMFWVNLGALAAFTLAFEAWRGQTPGKWLAGIWVRSALGGPPSLMQIALRNAARFIDMFPVLFPGAVGVIVAMFNPGRQRIGDSIGATIVRRHCPLPRRRFILASASPRRLELIRALGFEAERIPADIDEDGIHGDTPEETAGMLARAKARAALDNRSPDAGEIVIAADTMVVIDGETLGKPKDAAEAKAMLRRLSGRSHQVLTGVSVWDTAAGHGLSDVETTEVEFRALTDREIDDYVATGDPLDKAGAYGIQTGHLVKEVRGSISNVAGLPMEMLQSMLEMLDS